MRYIYFLYAFIKSNFDWHKACNSRGTMQTPFPHHTDPSTLFSLERRRQRMREFLEAFDRHSWRITPELPVVLPVNASVASESSLSATDSVRP